MPIARQPVKRAMLTAVELETVALAPQDEDVEEIPELSEGAALVVDDGAEFVLSTNKKFDLILVDGFNEHAHPGQLNSLPFYQACRSCLNDQGVMAVNLLGLCKGVLGGFTHILPAFDERALLFPSCKSGNTIAFATEGERINISLDDLKDRVATLKEETGMNLSTTLDRLIESGLCKDNSLSI